MPIYTVEDAQTGKRYKIEGDRPPTESELQALIAGESQPEAQQDGFLDNVMDVAGEVAAGANRAALYVPDTLVEGFNTVAGTDIPTVSEGVERLTGGRPGRGGFMEPGMPRDAAGAFGEVFGPGAAALKAVQGRNVASVPGAAAEFLGFGSAAPTSAIPGAADATQEAISRIPPGQRPKRLPKPPEEAFTGADPRDLAVRRGRGDVAAAGYRMGPGGRTTSDAAQKRALKAGIDEGIVAQVASGSPDDKRRMAQMLDVVEQGFQNKTARDFSHPRAVLGETLMDRYKAIQDVNKQAGQALNDSLEGLRGQPANLDALFQGPVKEFLGDLKDAGVRVDGQGQVFFRGSDFEGLPEAQRIINNLVKRMSNTDAPDAYGLHRLKKFIDEQVNYGESVAGLKGSAVNTMKRLRHNLNNFMREQYPEYGRANQVYSDTIEVMNDVRDLLGKKNEVSERELGRIARRALSNAQSGGRVQDLLIDLDETAKRYGADLGDDVQRQVSFVQTLEKLFNVSPPASFKGDISKAVDQAVEMAGAASGSPGSMLGVAARGAGKVFTKSEKQRQDAVLKALRDMLSDGTNPKQGRTAR